MYDPLITTLIRAAGRCFKIMLPYPGAAHSYLLKYLQQMSFRGLSQKSARANAIADSRALDTSAEWRIVSITSILFSGLSRAYCQSEATCNVLVRAQKVQENGAPNTCEGSEIMPSTVVLRFPWSCITLANQTMNTSQILELSARVCQFSKFLRCVQLSHDSSLLFNCDSFIVRILLSPAFPKNKVHLWVSPLRPSSPQAGARRFSDSGACGKARPQHLIRMPRHQAKLRVKPLSSSGTASSNLSPCFDGLEAM